MLPVNMSGENYEVFALLCLNHDYEFLQEKLKNSPPGSDVFVIDTSPPKYILVYLSTGKYRYKMLLIRHTPAFLNMLIQSGFFLNRLMIPTPFL